MDLLFDPPWTVFAVLGLVAAVLLYTANARSDRRLMAAGLLAVLLGVVVYVVGALVETDREKVLRETREVVTAVDKHDWGKFTSLLDPHVQFAFYSSRDDLVKGAQRTVDLVGVKNVSVGNLTAAPEPGGYTVDFLATADIEANGQRVPTNWRFSWMKQGNGFALYRIQPLPSAFLPAEAVTSRLARP